MLTTISMHALQKIPARLDLCVSSVGSDSGGFKGWKVTFNLFDTIRPDKLTSFLVCCLYYVTLL